MATDRLISGKDGANTHGNPDADPGARSAPSRLVAPASTPDDEQANFALRPTRLSEYVGQSELLERLRICIEAAKKRKEPMEHLLLHGPPGLGKTTLAHVVAREMGTNLILESGPALSRGTDLVSALTRLAPGDVLFIDEIHRLPIQVEEFIYPAMEDFRVDVRVDGGIHASTVHIKVKPFTLIGATTRAGLLSSPLRSRFGILHHLRFYTPAELVQILERSAALLSVKSERVALELIAARSRATPRVANRLLRRVRDYALVRADGKITPPVVEAALKLEGIDALGLDPLDHLYLKTLGTVYRGGPAGLETIAATMNEDAGTLEDVVEPYLLQIGFLARTRRGRALTKAACEHTGVAYRAPADDDGLFG
jgi:Holliday junction DNA helicase RuvB